MISDTQINMFIGYVVVDHWTFVANNVRTQTVLFREKGPTCVPINFPV